MVKLSGLLIGRSSKNRDADLWNRLKTAESANCVALLGAPVMIMIVGWFAAIVA